MGHRAQGVPPNTDIKFQTTTKRQPIKHWLLSGANWRFLLLIIKMADKTVHDMISYIKQILWWRRLLVALFADLAFRQLAVINSADLKYQLHLFQGAINKLLQPIKGASFLRLFVKPGQTDMGSVQAALASAEHVWVQVFHMLTDLSFTLLGTWNFFIRRKPHFRQATNSAGSVRAGQILDHMPEVWNY